MFGNFLYFIVVLLIFSTYQPTEETNFSGSDTLLFFLCGAALFAAVTWLQFRRLAQVSGRADRSWSLHRFDSLVTRHSILAVALFAVDIYALNLPAYVPDLFPAIETPTLEALVFLALFIAHLIVIWVCAHPLYRELYDAEISRRAYVYSNLSYALPVLLPWFLLSALADLLQALPFPGLQRLLDTTEGQVAYFLVFLFAVAVVGPALIQRFWRCRPMTQGTTRARIESVCRRAGLAYADILYWPIFGGRVITAGVMGLIRRFRYILVTDALIRLLQPIEIDAVVAHEIGHVKKRHLMFYLFFFIGYMLLSYTTFNFIVYLMIYAQPLLSVMHRLGISQTTAGSLLFSFILIVIFLIYFRFIFGYFMRNFERQADTYVYTLFDTAQPLISTLQKIAWTSGQPADKPNWHHFSISERVDYLQRCEGDRRWIRRQDRKVNRSIAAYAIAILLVAGWGVHLNFGESGRKFNARFFEKIVAGELAKHPYDPSLYSMLGDLHFELHNFNAAIDAYSRAIALAPEASRALNNLSWLLATCEDQNLRDPQRALALAQRAAAIDSSPHVLDTLAEAFFVNGLTQKAIEAEMRALEGATENRAYYEGQLLKFKRAPEG